MSQAGSTLGIAAMMITGLVACSPSGASVHGLDFDAKDAVYLRVDDSESNDHKNLVLLIADVDDLCERANSGESFAGRSKLLIRNRWTGSAHFQYKRYGQDCEVMHNETTGQGWVETGELTARSCVVPDGILERCN